MTHIFFIAVDKAETIASNYSRDLQSLSIRRGDILILVYFPRLPVSANNLPVFEDFSDTPHKISSS